MFLWIASIVAAVCLYIFIARFTYGVLRRLSYNIWNDMMAGFWFASIPYLLMQAAVKRLTQSDDPLGYQVADWMLRRSEQKRKAARLRVAEVERKNQRLRLQMEEIQRDLDQELEQRNQLQLQE